MDQISLSLNKDSLLSFFKDFHTLTGIKIALFTELGQEILSYPQHHCPFCVSMRSSQAGNMACEISNEKSFKRCQKTKKLEIYQCHAGLIETTAPLIDNGVVIGYIMFGQITDNPNKSQVRTALSHALSSYDSNNYGVNAAIYDVDYKSREQIHATAKILEACTFYVLLNNMISIQSKNFIKNLNSFLKSHLSEDLSVDRLTAEFNISKNKLYDTCSKYMSTGIAEHIKKLRIEEAKRLLKESDLPVYAIADKVGFNDYNYFCRIFKKEVGLPAKKYRASKS
ncbi:MAG: PocR ligand-binding domain-containing protein [Lachnospiraceae bacterium]|nr:PocR ligand-binding domain-containing protein [Lachnospiraceae bacterium]